AILLIAITFGSIVGLIKGTEAKQRWMFKVKVRNEEKRQLAQQKKLIKKGVIPLDDIELAAFHNN
ncbi:MAG: hypothetical protein ABW174_10255, partial [Flavitalea sp.]